MKDLCGYVVLAGNREVGKVHDFYFHDDTWLIRYLVVETGHWLARRKVLITPGALGKPHWAGFNFPVALTPEQIEKSPDIDTEKPVSRQQETDLHNHYGWPFYWVDPGPGAWPPFMPLGPLPAACASPHALPEEKKDKKADPHLRSAREVTGYHIHASDGEMGHVEDFIVEDAIWVIRYMVVHASNWFPARKVLISPQWLGEINHLARRVAVTLARDAILQCPEFDPETPVNREYEGRLSGYFGRAEYCKETDRPTGGGK
jgi:hypothetical protein